jgi:thymidylate synthase (FAD)
VNVNLFSHTPEPVRVLWTAARACYSGKTPQELWEEYPGPAKAVKLLRSLWLRGHQSVFEHVTLTYAVSGVSRVLLAQYSRHRIGVSLSVQSQRHVSMKEVLAVYPNCLGTARSLIDQLYQWAWDTYELLLESGVPKEDARFVLPQGAATNFVTTVNLRSLMHLYYVRVLEPGAQWEIRDLVREMVRLAAEAVPELPVIMPEVKLAYMEISYPMTKTKSSRF